jgi:hypothetical protein
VSVGFTISGFDWRRFHYDPISGALVGASWGTDYPAWCGDPFVGKDTTAGDTSGTLCGACLLCGQTSGGQIPPCDLDGG